MNLPQTKCRVMKTVTDNFNKAYPDLASSSFTGTCCINEHDNGNTDKFQQAVLTGLDGYIFPHELMGRASSFASMSGHKGVLALDCEQVVLFEHNGKKYILLCELKSNYICENIVHAKDQIVGSSVKMKSLLSSLQGFDKSEYKIIGLIVSFEPTEEQITNITKNEGPKSAFAIRLQADKKYSMPAARTNRFFKPLEVGDIDLYYVAVPDRRTAYTIDIGTLMLN